MQSAYVNAKLNVTEGSQYCTGNMYFWQGVPGGWIVNQHAIVGDTPDKSQSISPPTSLTFANNVLNVNDGQIIVDGNANTILWSSPGWSGSASCEYLSLEVREDDGTVTNIER